MIGFRNYKAEQISFSSGINVIIGENGQGKTNLLEAIYYLSGAKSFRTRFDKELMGLQAEYAKLSASIYAEERTQNIQILLTRGRKKELFINDVKQKKQSDLSGKACVVLFSPEDLTLVKGGASERRRFMDFSISQMRPKYAVWLSEFHRLYEHKTRILKDSAEKPSLLETLDDFNYHLAKAGAQLIYYRAAFLKKLSLYAGKIHADFSGGKESLALHYETVKEVSDPNERPQVLLEGLLKQQERLKNAEIDAKMCLAGVQKDDISVLIDDMPARAFASQGQTRTAALSMKLAERDIIFDDCGAYPILLLDDVLSELDAARQDYVLNRIVDGQVFITCCEESEITKRTGGMVFEICEGSLLRKVEGDHYVSSPGDGNNRAAGRDLGNF